MTTTTTAPPVLGALARQEVRGYLRSKLFWCSVPLWALLCVSGLLFPSEDYSTTGDGLGTAMVLGVFGLVIMAGRVRSSDRAAASGAVTVPQRTRTLALASAAVVPGTMGLVWFACAVTGYQLDPPSAFAAPFGEHSEMDFYAAMFAEGVTPAVGGPLLGLLVARWLPGRGVAPLLAVVIVLATVVLQPLFGWAEWPRLAWVWIHFFGPGGIDGDPERFLAYPGSPYFYIGYQAALCALAVLVAMYRDPEGDRPALRRKIAAVGCAAVVLCGLAFVAGTDATQPSPVPSPAAAP